MSAQPHFDANRANSQFATGPNTAHAPDPKAPMRTKSKPNPLAQLNWSFR